MTYEITRKQAEQAAYEADLDLDRGDLRTSYSGRGMYGANCVGIVGSSFGAVYRFLKALEEVDIDIDVLDLADHTSTDNMGMDTIWYWPDLRVSDPDADDREDEGEDEI